MDRALMYHFFLILLDEPGLTSLGGYPDGLSQESKDRYRSFLEEGVSVIAIDKTNDFICGAMLSMMFTRYLLFKYSKFPNKYSR